MVSSSPQFTEVNHDRSVVIAAGNYVRYSDMYKQHATNPLNGPDKDFIESLCKTYRNVY